MSQLPRPIFTKSRTTKRPRSSTAGANRAGGGGRGNSGRPSRAPGRFHGAFEGGHSAGFFNTVGSRDGWKPTNEDDWEDADDGEFDEFGRSANRTGGADGSADQQKKATDQSNDILGAAASSSIGSGGKRPRVWDRNRSAEDYMDDRDYGDWGGPTGVSAEYSDPSASTAIAETIDDGSQQHQEGLGLLVPTELLQSMAVPTDAIGRLLLRKLGWREGSGTGDKSSAYVPTHDDNGGYENGNDKACSHEALLSKKRLKKIQLSERGHSLPPAKIDTYGLGYDPFRNAPEFAAHREERRKRAEERARGAGGGGGQGRYHTSDLLDDENGDDGGDAVHNAKARASNERGGVNKSTNVLAYETAEDFIGRKGTAGFALEDDDDDVYDNVLVASSGMSSVGAGHASKFVGIGGEEYHTELIDHGSDAEGDESLQAKHGGSVAFAGALSAWATGDETNSAIGGMSSTTKAVTSDGQAPLDGFILGGSGGEKDITNKRFPGPDLPPNFEPLRHVFREGDLPEQVAEQSKKAKEEAEKTRGAQSDGAATSQSYTNPQKRDDVMPMAGNAFAGLAAAMKNRFTSGGPDAKKTDDKDRIGLRMPNSMSDVGSVALAVPTSKEEGEKKEIQVKRSTILWNPEPLLCKRFGVRPPSRSKTPISTHQKQTEEIYFKKEILGAAGAAAATASTPDPSGDGAVNAGDIGNNDVPIRPPQPGDDIGESRPPMDLFKSIFGASSSDSDDSSSSNEDDSNGEGSAAAIGTSKDKSTPVTNFPVDSGSIGDGTGAENNKKTADNQEATHAERSAGGNEDKDKSRKYRHRSRRSRSSGSASSESSVSSSSYERRKWKKKSKRRKKERSKRHDDERKRPKEERRKKKRRKRSRSRSRSRDRGGDIEGKPSKQSSRSTSGRDS